MPAIGKMNQAYIIKIKASEHNLRHFAGSLFYNMTRKHDKNFFNDKDLKKYLVK